MFGRAPRGGDYVPMYIHRDDREQLRAVGEGIYDSFRRRSDGTFTRAYRIYDKTAVPQRPGEWQELVTLVAMRVVVEVGGRWLLPYAMRRFRTGWSGVRTVFGRKSAQGNPNAQATLRIHELASSPGHFVTAVDALQVSADTAEQGLSGDRRLLEIYAVGLAVMEILDSLDEGQVPGVMFDQHGWEAALERLSDPELLARLRAAEERLAVETSRDAAAQRLLELPSGDAQG